MDQSDRSLRVLVHNNNLMFLKGTIDLYFWTVIYGFGDIGRKLTDGAQNRFK